MREYQEKMLRKGWVAVRDLSDEIVEWQDPDEPKHVWSDQEVELYYGAGDCIESLGGRPVPQTVRGMGRRVGYL